MINCTQCSLGQYDSYDDNEQEVVRGEGSKQMQDTDSCITPLCFASACRLDFLIIKICRYLFRWYPCPLQLGDLNTCVSYSFFKGEQPREAQTEGMSLAHMDIKNDAI